MFLHKPEIIKGIIDAGSQRAREIASRTVSETVKAIKLNYLK